ncbi:Hypothetical protein, putative [Bodo saltans]|uniref:Coiled-coil domain-containing protein n=1 Tax=Bodo saltans TaxID=75058 RepID=A0A0S4JL95_BODSA|nr:Hypothetical protein, putative [Bodo saltans]|eukprot:CUG89232.1 Hypothetical protein, putative [Bodo saltans]
MPSGPKNKFTNRHAEEARERDNDRQSASKAAADKAREDALWQDDDAKAKKRQDKAQLESEKAEDIERRRAERLQQLDDEDRELSKAKVPVKVQKRVLQKDVAKMLAAYDKEATKMRPTLDDAPPALPTGSQHVNRNREHAEEVNASDITAALAALDFSKGIPDDRHIGKRARVLYKHFCDENLPKIKEEHRGLKRSQYNDRLWDLWQSSPQNPFVQRKESRNSDRMQAERAWFAGEDEEGAE